MKQLLFTIVLILGLIQITFGQEVGDNQFHFNKKGNNYFTTDTIVITYFLDSLEILHSNFGGCGGGVVYFLTCHSDSLLSQTSAPECDYLLPEYWYAKSGSFQTKIVSAGIYSISFYVKFQHQLEVSESKRYTHVITTPKFEVHSVKE